MNTISTIIDIFLPCKFDSSQVQWVTVVVRIVGCFVVVVVNILVTVRSVDISFFLVYASVTLFFVLA